VRHVLTNPNYAGTYVYSKTRSQPGGPILAKGYSKRIKIPEKEWIKIPGHHPSYLTQEEQEDIKSILKKNQFNRRQRPGRGPAPLQGLLRCSVCGYTLSVFYPRKDHLYVCSMEQQYGRRSCTRFMSGAFDRAILREVFKVLKRPPLEMLKTALEASREQKQRRLKWIQSERERYAHEECLARERADLTRGKLPNVYWDALQRQEKATQERNEFERNVAAMTGLDSQDGSEEELEELCRIASDVPSLWEHEAITNQERKELLRCVIDHIIVAATKTKIDATIVWQSGGRTSLTTWQRGSSANLIRELHAQKLTTPEIREHLAAGKTSTGQVVNITCGGLYQALGKLGLKPHHRSLGYFSALEKAVELDREGQSAQSIAQYLNEHGFSKDRGKTWTQHMVRDLLFSNGKKLEPLENVHRRMIGEALARGIDYSQIADELNEKNVRRKGGQRWDAECVATRWYYLNAMGGKREQPPVRKKSALTVWQWHVWSLVRELHAQKLTVPEIREHLAAGKTLTGEAVSLTLRGLYHILRHLGLKPHHRSLGYFSALEKAVELDREGQSAQSIAQYFNEHGFTKDRGKKTWTQYMVRELFRDKKLEPLENVHRRMIGEALARGIDYSQIADELNEKNVRRKGGQRWTAECVATRWYYLNAMGRKREQPLVRKKSA
jgi:Recombinase/Recombinase zinc beta ribbon domain